MLTDYEALAEVVPALAVSERLPLPPSSPPNLVRLRQVHPPPPLPHPPPPGAPTTTTTNYAQTFCVLPSWMLHSQQVALAVHCNVLKPNWQVRTHSLCQY